MSEEEGARFDVAVQLMRPQFRAYIDHKHESQDLNLVCESNTTAKEDNISGRAGRPCAVLIQGAILVQYVLYTSRVGDHKGGDATWKNRLKSLSCSTF